MAFLSWSTIYLLFVAKKSWHLLLHQEERKPKSHVHSIMESVIAMISFRWGCDVGKIFIGLLGSFFEVRILLIFNYYYRILIKLLETLGILQNKNWRASYVEDFKLFHWIWRTAWFSWLSQLIWIFKRNQMPTRDYTVRLYQGETVQWSLKYDARKKYQKFFSNLQFKI